MKRHTHLVAVLALVLPLNVAGVLATTAGAADREPAGPFCATLYALQTYRDSQPGLFKGSTTVVAYLNGLENDVPYLQRAAGESPTVTLEYAFVKAVGDQHSAVEAAKVYLAQSALYRKNRLSASAYRSDVATDNKKQDAGLEGVSSVLNAPSIGVFCATN